MYLINIRENSAWFIDSMTKRNQLPGGSTATASSNSDAPYEGGDFLEKACLLTYRAPFPAISPPRYRLLSCRRDDFQLFPDALVGADPMHSSLCNWVYSLADSASGDSRLRSSIGPWITLAISRNLCHASVGFMLISG